MKKKTKCQHFYEVAFISSFPEMGEHTVDATVICRKCGNLKSVTVERNKNIWNSDYIAENFKKRYKEVTGIKYKEA